MPLPGKLDHSLGEFWVSNPWEIVAGGHNLSSFERNRVFLNHDGKEFFEVPSDIGKGLIEHHNDFGVYGLSTSSAGARTMGQSFTSAASPSAAPPPRSRPRRTEANATAASATATRSERR